MAGTVPYMALAEFKAASVMPADFIDEIELRTPGWIDGRLKFGSAWLDTRLAKRYDAPFRSPYPFAVQDWLAKIVTFECWLKRGVAASDEQIAEYKQQAASAFAEVREAADSKDGLFELPLRSNVDANGVTRGWPRVYSEQSPYAWADLQRDIGRNEDYGNG